MQELLACGFNAHGQLGHSPEFGDEDPSPSDLRSFRQIAAGEKIDVLLAGWSRTLILQDSTIVQLGYNSSDPDIQRRSVQVDFPIRCTFAPDKPFLSGFVSATGNLYFLTQSEGPPDAFGLFHQGDDDSPKLSYVAVSATNRTCISFQQSPASELIHLLEFKQYSDFVLWFGDPALFPSFADDQGLKQPIHHMVQGRIVDLQAGATTFTMLTEAGNVYTWTNDARHHRCLGRSPSTEAPAATPGLVDALGGVPISKVAVGGWMSAALSRDKDAYMWGKERPREGTQKIAALPGNDEDLQLVDLGDGVDVIDIGVGSGHAVVVASNGRVFAAGENDNGQLGLEADSAEFESDWREVKGLRGKKVKSIWCGDNTSLVLVEP